ncbi:hypothetical protein JST97_17880 [bacterium]|nr:hypothetical protein [bacterium]
MLSIKAPMALEEVLRLLDINQKEAEDLFREAKIPASHEQFSAPDLARLDIALERVCHKLAGRDWRRADGADRQEFGSSEISDYELFHRKTGQRQVLKTFGELLRWAEGEYGWRS